MKIEKTSQEDHQVTLIVEIDDQDFISAKQKAAKKISSKSKIPGFRPGKAPYQIILKHFGENAIIEEAIEIVANDIYPKAIEESEIKPYGPGTLQNVVKTDPLTLEFLVPLDAEVILRDYKDIRLPYQKPEVSKDEIIGVLNNLRDQNAILQTVDRKASLGDQVTIKLRVDRTDTPEDQNPVIIPERVVPIQIIEENDLKEWPYPGFSGNLINMEKDEEKVVVYTYPDDSPLTTLKNVEARFEFSIEEVSSRTLPELTDEFAKTVGDFENIEKLEEAVKTSIETNKLNTYNSEYEENVLASILEQAEVKYPPIMLEREIDNQLANLQNRLNSQGFDMDLYLKSRQMDLDALRNEIRPDAINQLKRMLVIYELVDKEGITVTTDEVHSETNRALDSLSRVIDQKNVKQLSDRKVVSNIANNVMVDILTQKTLKRMRKIASGSETTEGEISPETDSAADQPDLAMETKNEIEPEETGGQTAKETNPDET